MKLRQIDMHLHTWFSDGDHSPKKVVRFCKRRGIKWFAITDHDTINGIIGYDGARAVARALDSIKIIEPANAEFTSVYNNETHHILGYCFDLENEKLNKFFSSQEQAKQDYTEKVINTLTQFGFEISLNDVLCFARGHISDIHIYKAILEHYDKNSKNQHILQKHHIETFKNFNKTFLKGVIQFEKQKLPAKDVIKMIRDAGGYAVLAHPFWKRSATIYNIQERIENLQKMGLNGLEAFYFRHNQEATLKLHEIAQELSTHENPMYETIGSDFHSFNRPGESRTMGKINFYGINEQNINLFLPL